MAATHTDIWQRARVVETTVITERLRRIVFEVALPVAVAPGAHVDVRLQIGDQVDRRSYSIVDASADGLRLALTVFRSESSRGGAAVMHALVPGDEVEMTQPLLDFPLRIGAPGYVLLAGGIGITAVVEMARVLRSVGADYRVVYVGRSREEMAYLPSLEAAHGDRLTVHVSDEGTPLIVGEFIRTLHPSVELYMCGPIRLMDAVRRTWTEHGLPLPNLRFETFGNSGWHAPEPFVVRLPQQSLEVTVGPDETMLEALESAGADMMYDCRKGECGLCEVRVLHLDGGIDHRDVFYSERQKDARAKLCCCVSRVVTDDGSRPVVTIEAS
jgi:vanillate monooxygenase ferredoxin subunit